MVSLGIFPFISIDFLKNIYIRTCKKYIFEHVIECKLGKEVGNEE